VLPRHRRLDRGPPPFRRANSRFVVDSALEGDGFELPVPRENGYSVEPSYFAYLIASKPKFRLEQMIKTSTVPVFGRLGDA
jgi:hypothetical protein